jgi:hypothetical protein
MMYISSTTVSCRDYTLVVLISSHDSVGYDGVNICCLMLFDLFCIIFEDMTGGMMVKWGSNIRGHYEVSPSNNC